MTLRRAAIRAIPLLILLMTGYSVFPVTADDPYITFRYAANLLAGHGPVYNIGERVEGFSSPLFLLLTAILLKFLPAIDIIFKAKLLSLLFGAIALLQVQSLARRIGFSESAAVFAASLPAANINYALAAVNGMETTLDTCLILACAALLWQECKGREGARSAWILFLTLLARPETLLLFAALLGVQCFRLWQRTLTLASLLRWTAVFVIPACALTLARLIYYGLPLPNTYYAKHVEFAAGLKLGFFYLLAPLAPIRIDPGQILHSFQSLATLCFWLLSFIGLGSIRPRLLGQALFAPIAALIVFSLLTGGDWMAGWRFMVPVLPLVALLQCAGLQQLAVITKRRPVGLVGAGLASLFWGYCFLTSPHETWAEAGFSTHSATLIAAKSALGGKWVATANYIRANLAPGTLIAYSEMGYAGYLNLDKSFLDTRGLTDREVAALPSRFKGNWGVDDESWFIPGDPLYNILLRRHPGAIIAFSHRTLPAQVLNNYLFSAAINGPGNNENEIESSFIYLPLHH